MGRIEKTAQRANLFASLVGHGWIALNLLGVSGWVSGAALLAGGVIWAWVVRVTSDLPWWAFALVTAAGLVLLARLYVEGRRAWALRGVKQLDIARLGRDCVQYRDDLLGFLVDRIDGAPDRNAGLLEAPEERGRAMEAAWARGVAYSNQTRSRLVQRFAHRTIALNHMLSAAGIAPVDLWGFDHNAAGIAAHIGAIGELLERGLLAEARTLSTTNDVRRAHLYWG